MVINKSTQDLYNQYKGIKQQAADIYYAMAVLGWDQEVYMPANGARFRGQQLSTLASLAHNLVTSEEYGNILDALNSKGDLSGDDLRNVQLSYEDYSKSKKLSASFVAATTEQTSKSYTAWIRARRENNFSIYAPELDKMIALKIQQADLYGYESHPYDSLMDDYEKGATVSMLDPVFSEVKEKLTPLIKLINDAAQVDDSFLFQHFGKDQQWDFSLDVLKTMQYDFTAGRQDLSEHPFTTSFSPEDVRVTTRVDEKDFASLLWSSIHEGGHALYEQGLPTNQYGLPLGEAASLSVHESQSRLWENCVGRGEAFWKYFYPKLQGRFKEQLGNVSLAQFSKGINKVQPSLIRTEADELTYHTHVMIRYEVEKSLISKDVASTQVAELWNSMYQKYLNITPPDDKQGVLQDVHWAHGSFGYFPTYSLGSFYACQYYAQAKNELSSLEQQVENGEFSDLLNWLRSNIHIHGRRYRSNELCEKVTGKGLDISVFVDYANEKYKTVYGLKL